MSRRTAAAAAAALVLLAGCAARPPGALPSVTGPAEGPAPVFAVCGREAPDPSWTNLQPSALTPADRAAVAGWPGGPLPEGRVVLEHAADLPLPTGRLGFGNGYEAATGALAAGALHEVAEPGTTAAVTLAVLDSPTTGRRVAFVEVHLADDAPVRWEEEPALGFGTDGGDGGVYSPPFADAPAASDEAAFDVIDVMYPEGDSSAGHVCAVRSTPAGVDGVLFSAGYGDGGYPTFLGYDADDDMVSAVSYGYVVPWALSGLPGTPPADVDL